MVTGRHRRSPEPPPPPLLARLNQPTPLRIAAVSLAAFGGVTCGIAGLATTAAPDAMAAADNTEPWPTQEADDPGRRGGPMGPLELPRIAPTAGVWEPHKGRVVADDEPELWTAPEVVSVPEVVQETTTAAATTTTAAASIPTVSSATSSAAATTSSSATTTTASSQPTESSTPDNTETTQTSDTETTIEATTTTEESPDE